MKIEIKKYIVTIDKEDLERINKLVWTPVIKGKNVYFVNNHTTRKYLHQFILGKKEGVVIDHIDRNTLNNCKSNLRFTDKHVNAINIEEPRVDNKSGFTGVSFDSNRNKWIARMKINGNYKFLGRFNKKEEAIKTIDHKNFELYGSYRRKRTLVLGDIHGASKALKQVLERCNWSPETDKIIQLGDVADGWSETSECVDILLDIKKKSVHEPVFIRGNHDVWVYDWMMFGLTPITWTTQGGKATMESYVRTGNLVDKGHKNFWFTQVDWYIDDKNRLFIHAGWDYRAKGTSYRNKPIVPFEEGLNDIELFQKQASLKINAGTIAKECHWDRSIIKNAAAVQVFKDKGMHDYNKKVQKALNTFREVYIGHSASKNHQVENFCNLWNLDSGSGWNGRLSIMDIDTKEIWYADFSTELYPNELGRG